MYTHKKIFVYSLYLSNILYLLALLGVSSFAPQYLDSLDNFIKIYISFFLVINFNPYTKNRILNSNDNFDRQLAFTAGIYLLLTTSLTSYVKKYITYDKKEKKYEKKLYIIPSLIYFILSTSFITYLL